MSWLETYVLFSEVFNREIPLYRHALIILLSRIIFWQACSTFLLQAYGSQLVRKAQYRHVLARSYFSRIPDMAEQMKGKIQELPLPRPKEREIVARVRTDTQGQSVLDKQKQQQMVAVWANRWTCIIILLYWSLSWYATLYLNLHTSVLIKGGVFVSGGRFFISWAHAYYNDRGHALYSFGKD